MDSRLQSLADVLVKVLVREILEMQYPAIEGVEQRQTGLERGNKMPVDAVHGKKYLKRQQP